MTLFAALAPLLLLAVVSEACNTVGSEGVGAGKKCIFPFTFKGSTYSVCTAVEHKTAWCATEVDAQGNQVEGKWGECADDCQACKTVSTDGVGANHTCLFPFTYKGKAYSECTAVDDYVKRISDKSGWCATEVDSNGNGGRDGAFGLCGNNCQAEVCAKYAGILHKDGKTCCASNCGKYCGADDCDKGTGGEKACCASKIPDKNICGEEYDVAPCTLKATAQEDLCTKYGGILHKDKMTCCASSCEKYCGADDCDKGNGGGNACCASKISDQKLCSNGQLAPCTLKADEHGIFTGMLGGCIRQVASMSWPLVIAALVL